MGEGSEETRVEELVGGGQRVEERYVGGEEVAGGGEVAGSEGGEKLFGGSV